MPVKTPEPMKKAPKSKASTKKQSKKTSAAEETNVRAHVRKRITSKRQPAAHVVDVVDDPAILEPAPSEGAPSTAASDVDSEVSPYPT